jgi:hypothetical protein
MYPIYYNNWRNISTIYIASNEIFSPSNKIHREVGRAKDLSAPGNNSMTPFTGVYNLTPKDIQYYIKVIFAIMSQNFKINTLLSRSTS